MHSFRYSAAVDSDCEGSRAPGLILFNNFSAFLHHGFSFCMFHFIRGQLSVDILIFSIWYKIGIVRFLENSKAFHDFRELFCRRCTFVLLTFAQHLAVNTKIKTQTIIQKPFKPGNISAHIVQPPRNHSTFSFQVTQPLLK